MSRCRIARRLASSAQAEKRRIHGESAARLATKVSCSLQPPFPYGGGPVAGLGRRAFAAPFADRALETGAVRSAARGGECRLAWHLALPPTPLTTPTLVTKERIK